MAIMTETDITKRNTLARTQKMLDEYCRDEYDIDAEAAADSLNDLLKFDEFDLHLHVVQN